ncbi:MAG: sensor histidine kinase [Streptosporangiaceae bacterium]|nr:sensor histidine kinase [Streptosporangiaceae bacterium]
MTIRVFWLIRFTGFVLVGILALINPPHSPAQRAIQIAGFTVVGVALLACLLAGEFPRYRAWGLPVALGVMATAGGVASVTSGGGQSLVAFAGVAAMAAGADTGLPAGIAVAVAGILPIWIAGPVNGSSLGTLAGYPLLIVACLSFGRNRRSYRVQAEQAAALLEQYERLRAEQRRADVLDERARIAREIHDVLAHSLGALGIQIQAAKAMLTDQRDTGRAVEALATAQRMAADGLTETRRAVHALRVDTLPLGEELAGVVDTHRQRYHVPVIFETSGTIRALPPDASLTLLRTAQEALVNAARHASGQQVAVRLHYDDTGVRLTVVNHVNGTVREAKGPTSTGGYGLTGMRERLRLLNGTLLAGPRDSEWAVTAELPLAPEDAAR